LRNAIDGAKFTLKNRSQLVYAKRWQGVDVSKKPEMGMYEVLHYSFKAPVPDNLDKLRELVEPHLPWADDHFAERVAGQPVNPGETWRSWPYALSADKFRTEDEQFTHTYMERYWPKKASDRGLPMHGIRYLYGDLSDLILQLVEEPDTRQAYLPVWFPEDTGAVHKGRVPCTLGYHFIMRNNQFDCTYYLRSCDFVRHFRDDIYLTARLQLHILDMLKRMGGDAWETVEPGSLIMHMTSLHMFKNDYRRMFDNKESYNVDIQTSLPSAD
jgi:hypothetical protein